jgi:hypothetical protein
MKPVSPVIPGRYDLGQYETLIAKDQPEYITLPAIITTGLVTTRWRLSFVERVKVLLFGNVFLQVLKGKGDLQPVKLFIKKPTVLDCM